MKKIRNFGIVLMCALFLSSCYSYTSMIGTGPKEYKKDTKWNHYFIYGLIPAKTSDSKKMAEGATDYKIYTRETFVNGLVSGLTFGIYTPTTTTVTK